MPSNEIESAFRQMRRAQSRLIKKIGQTVTLKKSGKSGKLLMVGYGQAEIMLDGETMVTLVHVTAVK